MTWNESFGCVVLEPGEAVRTRAEDLVSFMRTCDFYGKAMLRFASCTRSDVRFYLDKDMKRELDPFRTFRWMKTVEYLVAWQKDPGKVATVTVVQHLGRPVEWKIVPDFGCIKVAASESLDDCARRICGKLLESVRPEPVRRLEADLAARKFVADAELRRMLAG